MSFEKGEYQGERETEVSIHASASQGIKFIDSDGDVIFCIPPDKYDLIRMGKMFIEVGLEIQDPQSEVVKLHS